MRHIPQTDQHQLQTHYGHVYLYERVHKSFILLDMELIFPPCFRCRHVKYSTRMQNLAVVSRTTVFWCFFMARTIMAVREWEVEVYPARAQQQYRAIISH